MSYRPKLIATDLDGTICPHAAPISKRTISTLTRAYNEGVKIFFVTGRPPRWMGQIKEAFNFGQAICSNGGLLWDLHEEKVLEEFNLNVDFVKKEMDEDFIDIACFDIGKINFSFYIERINLKQLKILTKFKSRN